MTFSADKGWEGRVLGGIREAESTTVADAGTDPFRSRYELREALGEGAYAIVHRAFDRRLQREVAIKLARPSAILPLHARDRFAREAKALAGITHPHVVAVHDYGMTEGRPFLVLELVEGRTLGEAMNGPRLSLPEKLRLLEQAARGVHAAHAHGIVHRDLKPSNILVSQSNEAKVADFGLALLSDPNDRMTRTGLALGTPSYMAPEQVEGKRDDVTPQTDIYALGAVLYEILTKRPPYVGETLTELYERILHSTPPPVAKLVPGLPADLETIARKAMERASKDRYATAEAFADDLNRHLRGEEIVAHPLSRTTRILRGLTRHRRMLAAASLLLLAGILLFFRYRGDLEGLEDRRAREREAMALIETGRVPLERAIRTMYERDTPMEETRRLCAESRSFFERAESLCSESPVAPFLSGCAWEIEGREKRAEESWRRAVSLDPTFGQARWRLGRLLLARSSDAAFDVELDGGRPGGRVGSRAGLAEQARREIEAAISGGIVFQDEMDRLRIDMTAAHLRGDEAALHRILRDGLDRFGNREGGEEFHWMAGWHALSEKNLADARASLEQAIRIRPRFARAHFLLGIASEASGDTRRAEREFTAAYESLPELIWALVNRGTLRSRAGDAPGALADYDGALAIDPGNPITLFNRAHLRMEMGELDGAQNDIEQALKQDPSDASHHQLLGTIRLARSEQLESAGKRADAALERGEALRTFDRAVELDAKDPVSWLNRGYGRLRQNLYAAAVEDFSRALELDPKRPDALLNRAISKSALGCLAEAIDDYSSFIATSPTDPVGWFLRGEARYRYGDFSDSISDLTCFLELAPKDSPDRAAALRYLTKMGAGEDH